MVFTYFSTRETPHFNTSIARVIFLNEIKPEPYLHALMERKKRPGVIKINVQPNTNSTIPSVHGSIFPNSSQEKQCFQLF